MKKDKKLRTQFFFDLVHRRLGLVAKGMMSLFLAVIFCGTAIAQQEIEVSGTVSTSDGETLPGVSIALEGTQTGTTTDLDGNYVIDAPSDGTLVFSFVGYQTVRESINGRTTINVTMEESIANLDELIVTGYSSQRQADITGAVSTVQVEDLARNNSASVLQQMEGRVAGVTFTSNGSPGSRNVVRIRGISSFQNNDPLFIVDGTPIEDNYLNFLNPQDIESMQVLKDAASASIYGARASNGVVIIETKQGRAGAPQVSFNANWGVATPVKGYDDFLILDALDYHEIVKRSHENAGLSVPTNIYGDPNNPTIPNYIYPNDGVNQTNDLSRFGLTEDDFELCNCDRLIMPGSEGTNWWDELFDPALTQNYNLGIAGGSESATYNVSFNFFDQNGTMKRNYYKRGTIRANTQFEAGIFTFGENASYVIDQTVGGMQSGEMGEGTNVGQLIKMQPVIPVFAVNGENYAGAKANGLGNGENPVWQTWRDRFDTNTTNRFVGNAFATADLYPGLQFKSSFGFNVGEGNSVNFSLPTYAASEPTLVTSHSENWNRFSNWTFSNTLTYIGNFQGGHNVNALVGTESNRTNFRNINGFLAGFTTTDTDTRYIQDALGDPGTKNVSSIGGFSTLMSFFGKVDYNYAEKYYLSVTLRRDGSSRLGDNSRWGTFPAFSVGWRITEESFMEGIEALNDLKLRFAYGVTGNQQIPTGRAVDQFGGSTGSTFYDITGSNGSLIPGLRNTDLGNQDLKWEENISYNFGLDANLFDGRLNFVLDVYQREVNDLLFNPEIPATQGTASPPWQNVGKMRNRGIDVQLGYTGTVSNDFSWSVDLTGSHYTNEIVRIFGDQDFFFGAGGGRQGVLNINQLGHSVGAFYGYKTDGLFMNQAEVDAHVDQSGKAPGRFRFVDTNGDGIINASDKTIIGSPHPDFTGGLNLGVNWKNFDFSTFLYASIGNDIFDLTKEFTVFRLFSTN
ncbi:MAG: SusC/RagA family TonB-linked outer membrane protein, partial [Balneolaceae bacterium]|nr:SusC/RagA family TonB-linked outer membrane protein [Balneolaceae bacterium]